jgi:four helix bundle protein
MFNFEKLKVWQKAIDFADNVYRLTRNFSDDERFGLTSQMRRAAVFRMLSGLRESLGAA